MARRRNNSYVIPAAAPAMDDFKGRIMAEEGYQVNPAKPNEVKYEVANDLGVPLNSDYNGELTTKNAGKVGGHIGGKMVQEMIRMAQEEIAKNNS